MKKRLFAIAKKEVKQLFRDRRTIERTSKICYLADCVWIGNLCILTISCTSNFCQTGMILSFVFVARVGYDRYIEDKKYRQKGCNCFVVNQMFHLK